MSVRCEVLVIGGGIMGAATAFELAKRGVDTILLDRGDFGSGDTAKTAGVVRMNYTNPPVIRMALRARQILSSFSSHVGGPPVFSQVGYLFLVPADAIEKARQNAAVQVAESVEVAEVDTGGVQRYWPGISLDGVAAAYHEAKSGFAEPQPVVDGYIKSAQTKGARAWAGVSVSEIHNRNGRVVGAMTSKGDISARAVVVAAGAWSKRLAATCDIDLPIQFSLEQELIVSADPETAPTCCVSSLIDAIYLRPYPSARVPGSKVGILLGRGYPKEYESVDPDAVPANTTDEFETELRERVARRQPRLGKAAKVSSRAAVYDFTPDWHPILGPTEQAEGLLFATGGSGHGFKLGPAIGEMVASAYLKKPVAYAELGAYSLDRFVRGEVFTAAYGGNRA